MSQLTSKDRSPENKTRIYLGDELKKLKESAPPRMFSSLINAGVDRHQAIMELTPADLTPEEKALLSAVLSGSVLRGDGLRDCLKYMVAQVEDSGLEINQGYKTLLEKVSKASYAERMAMIEAVGL